VIELEEKCRELESVVEGMTNTFIEFSGRLLDSKTLGPDTTKELRETMKKFLVLSEKAAHDSLNTLPSTNLPDEQPETDAVVKNSDISPDIATHDFSRESRYLATMPSSFQINPILRDTSIQRATSTYGMKTIGPVDMNPWVNYGIWGLPQQISHSGMIPYIVAGRDSFASRLFFETIVCGLRSLRGEGPAEDAYNMFRFKFRYKSAPQIRTILDTVLNTLLHGTSQKWVDSLEAMKA
jgi:hypothetical protein